VFASEQAGRQRIFWATSKSADDAEERATPFLTVSSVLMGCQYGRDTHVARKKKAQSTRDKDVSNLSVSSFVTKQRCGRLETCAVCACDLTVRLYITSGVDENYYCKSNVTSLKHVKCRCH